MQEEIQEVSEDQKAVNQYLSSEQSTADSNSLTLEQMEMAAESFINNETPQVTNTPEVIAETMPPAIEQVKQDTPLPAEHHAALHDMQVDLNRQKQIAESASKKLERLKTDESYRNQELGIETPHVFDSEKDLMSDEYLQQIDVQGKQIARLEKAASDRKERDDADDLASAGRKADEVLYGDISKMQDEFPSMKTDLPFQQFDEKYCKWYDIMNQAGGDITKYANDESYRTEMDKLGYNPGISTADLKTGFKIYEGVARLNKDKKAGYNSNFARAFKETSEYGNLYREKYSPHQVAEEQALNDRVRDINSQPVVMDRQTAVSNDNMFVALQAELDRGVTTARMNEIFAILEKIQ